jgi:23S rRNA C2498 (ribose-2'-O)-methylase RlmM
VHSVQVDKVSRAYHKMKEAFTRIDCLREADTSQWTAIDVGAAPGGWYIHRPRRLRGAVLQQRLRSH